jgi:hypothetical protein
MPCSALIEPPWRARCRAPVRGWRPRREQRLDRRRARRIRDVVVQVAVAQVAEGHRPHAGKVSSNADPCARRNSGCARSAPKCRASCCARRAAAPRPCFHGAAATGPGFGPGFRRWWRRSPGRLRKPAQHVLERSRAWASPSVIGEFDQGEPGRGAAIRAGSFCSGRCCAISFSTVSDSSSNAVSPRRNRRGPATESHRVADAGKASNAVDWAAGNGNSLSVAAVMMPSVPSLPM